MEAKEFTVTLEKNPSISIKVITGHFTTSNAHTNYFVDVNRLKSNAKIAQQVARELAIPFMASTPVDTIVCMEKTEVIGAFFAEELSREGIASINSGNEIHVVSPVTNVNGNLTFQDNMVNLISGKNIILLVTSVSSGKTVSTAIECIVYYGGRLTAVSALFMSSSEKLKGEAHGLFTSDDIPGYKLYNTADCQMCKNGVKLDAIINSGGYKKIE